MKVVGVGAFTLPKAAFVSVKSFVLVCGNSLCVCAPSGEIESIVQLPHTFGAADLKVCVVLCACYTHAFCLADRS